jgi:hypothetical protein
MKIHRVLALGILMIGMLATSAFADQISISWFSGGYNGASLATIYNTQNQPVSSFTTFCLEDGEYFNPAYHYDFTVDSVVIQGTGSTLPHQGSPTSIVLTQGAVDLYHGFMNNTLGGASAVDVQNAIWIAQGYSPTLSNPLSTILLTYANENYAYTGTSVRVLNLYNSTNSDNLDGYGGQPAGVRQSFLVPDGGLTAMLLGLAIGGLAMISRKLRA